MNVSVEEHRFGRSGGGFFHGRDEPPNPDGSLRASSGAFTNRPFSYDVGPTSRIHRGDDPTEEDDDEKKIHSNRNNKENKGIVILKGGDKSSASTTTQPRRHEPLSDSIGHPPSRRDAGPTANLPRTRSLDPDGGRLDSDTPSVAASDQNQKYDIPQNHPQHSLSVQRSSSSTDPPATGSSQDSSSITLEQQHHHRPVPRLPFLEEDSSVHDASSYCWEPTTRESYLGTVNVPHPPALASLAESELTGSHNHLNDNSNSHSVPDENKELVQQLQKVLMESLPRTQQPQQQQPQKQPQIIPAMTNTETRPPQSPPPSPPSQPPNNVMLEFYCQTGTTALPCWFFQTSIEPLTREFPMELASYGLSTRKWRQLVRAVTRVATRHYRIGTAFLWTSYMVLVGVTVFLACCLGTNFMPAMTIGVGVVLVLFGAAFFVWGWATRGVLLQQEVVDLCQSVVPQLGSGIADIRYHGREQLEELAAAANNKRQKQQQPLVLLKQEQPELESIAQTTSTLLLPKGLWFALEIIVADTPPQNKNDVRAKEQWDDFEILVEEVARMTANDNHSNKNDSNRHDQNDSYSVEMAV
ncbi:expressed unknown protein [Seminavis robusta]|uniref:Transmembrane protein n=1 Tax=Seminavis robusta TaxID=568900 RepID=A0A9N8H6K5_9STRA|nr:expressed unknown protein [Seminavis robusta]|eukprot:Sro114_g056500.1 n/a (582) ;mRNA; f:88745-90490